MLYVLDEPSVGLHPSNVQDLRTTIAALVGNGNSIVMVEHDLELICTAHWIIELGPGAGRQGGTVVAEGGPDQLKPTRAQSSARSWPVRRASSATGRRHRRRTGRSPSRSASCITCAMSAPPSPCTVSPRWPDRPAPARPRSCSTASSRPRAPWCRDFRCRPRPLAQPRRNPPGRRDRCLPHRAELPLDPGDLLRGPWPSAPPVRRGSRRPAAEMDARALLLQHPRGPVPDVPRPRRDRPRRSVPARHQRSMPHLPRRPVQRANAHRAHR